MKEALLKTLIHVIELAVIMLAVYAAITWLNLPLSPELTTLVLAALAKFGRSHDAVPLGDYVNDR